MTEREQPPQASETQGPPLPRWAYKFVNPVMVGLLRSPFHSALSNALMVLIFDGRKSGKRYTIPVGYLQEGNKLYLFSHSGWAKNFEGGAPVGMRLRGTLVRGTATVTHDPAIIQRIVEMLVAARGEAMAQRMGFVAQANDGTSKARMPQGTTFIEITLDQA